MVWGGAWPRGPPLDPPLSLSYEQLQTVAMVGLLLS